MDKLKSFIIIPIGLLTACATQRPMMQQQAPFKGQQPREAIKQAQELPPSTLDKKQSSTPEKIVPIEQRKEKTKTVSSWVIRGAMAAKNKAKGWSASMNWAQHGPGSYQIRLMGPLGAGAVLINKTGKTITFQDGPKRVTSSNADELLLQQTGIRLPVTNLYYWVRGLPAPGKTSGERYDEANHLIQLRQSGYTVTFGNYTSVKGTDLPGIVRLDGNGVMVKVIIKNWAI